MSEENTADMNATCEALSARVAELEKALQDEVAKNEILVQQIVEAEDAIANREVESFKEVIDPEDSDYWRERLIENREGTLAVLNRMKAKKCAAPPKEDPAPKGKPLHNRETAPDPEPRADEAAALRLRNRAQELVARDGISFNLAFRRAEAEQAGK